MRNSRRRRNGYKPNRPPRYQVRPRLLQPTLWANTWPEDQARELTLADGTPVLTNIPELTDDEVRQLALELRQ
jgi:hypothetical protein